MVAFAGHDATSSVGLSTSDCPLLCNLQIFNEVSNEWETYGNETTTDYVDSYDDTGDCTWNLLTPASIGSTYSGSGMEPDIIYARYQVFDPNSDIQDKENAIYDPFEITLNWECSDDTVTIAEADNTPTQTYIIDVDESTAHVDTISPSVT